MDSFENYFVDVDADRNTNTSANLYLTWILVQPWFSPTTYCNTNTHKRTAPTRAQNNVHWDLIALILQHRTHTETHTVLDQHTGVTENLNPSRLAPLSYLMSKHAALVLPLPYSVIVLFSHDHKEDTETCKSLRFMFMCTSETLRETNKANINIETDFICIYKKSVKTLTLGKNCGTSRPTFELILLIILLL